MKMINTYNESELHQELKEIYALEYNGELEKKIEGSKSIADILLKNGDVIEIQTGSISALKSKIKFLLENKRKIKIVHPILIEKYIEMYDENENLLYRKKSPKKETVYSMLRGLTGVYEYLTNENFEIELLFVKVTEKRQKTPTKVQLKNKSRRHLKDWIPLGKRLDSIKEKQTFSSLQDYKNLIPSSVPENFTRKELQKAISENFSKDAAKWTSLLIWLLKRLENCVLAT